MSIDSWLNRRAAQARLHELARQMERLREEKLLLAAVISYAEGGSGVAPVSASGGLAPRPGRPSRSQSPSGAGESLTTLLVDAIAAGPAGKGWTIGELVESVRRTHPERLRARNASSLISAMLSQALRAKQPLFVSRKRRGKRSHLYRLAKP